MISRHALIIALLLRLFLGLFWVDHGWGKVSVGWLSENKLVARLERSNTDAQGVTKAYLERFAIPASGILRILVPLGELAVGLAFLAGFWMKPASWGAVFMVFNFKFADGDLGLLGAFGDPYLFPLVLATLLSAYLALGKGWTVKRWLPALDRFDV